MVGRGWREHGRSARESGSLRLSKLIDHVLHEMIGEDGRDFRARLYDPAARDVDDEPAERARVAGVVEQVEHLPAVQADGVGAVVSRVPDEAGRADLVADDPL